MNKPREITEKTMEKKLIQVIRECTDLSGQFPRVNQEEVSRRVQELMKLYVIKK
ncbi:hypothetical protein KW797_01360 [Candidatus Parcubacteria bacterium]|nr:hypothetical protein [Candidatus Parcubacteria bacterium]